MGKDWGERSHKKKVEPHGKRRTEKVRGMEYKRQIDKKLIPTCNIMGVNIAAFTWDVSIFNGIV